MRLPATRQDDLNWMICALGCDCGTSSIPARNRRYAQFGIHVARIAAYVRLRPRKHHYSVKRLCRRT
jgi:hypothetical protein